MLETMGSGALIIQITAPHFLGITSVWHSAAPSQCSARSLISRLQVWRGSESFLCSNLLLLGRTQVKHGLCYPEESMQGDERRKGAGRGGVCCPWHSRANILKGIGGLPWMRPPCGHLPCLQTLNIPNHHPNRCGVVLFPKEAPWMGIAART